MQTGSHSEGGILVNAQSHDYFNIHIYALSRFELIQTNSWGALDLIHIGIQFPNLDSSVWTHLMHILRVV